MNLSLNEQLADLKIRAEALQREQALAEADAQESQAALDDIKREVEQWGKEGEGIATKRTELETKLDRLEKDVDKLDQQLKDDLDEAKTDDQGKIDQKRQELAVARNEQKTAAKEVEKARDTVVKKRAAFDALKTCRDRLKARLAEIEQLLGTEPPRVYRRVKLSKDEPYEREETDPFLQCRIPRARRSAVSRTSRRLCQRQPGLPSYSTEARLLS